MEKNYAYLIDRVKAAIVDGIIIIGAMYGISEIFALFENVPNYFRVIAAISLFILYDPFFTTKYGGTIGHSYSGICVRKENDMSQNIAFPNAVLRFLFKASLGWLSLLTVSTNEKKRAIHDLVANSVVVKNDD
jgi:uncharacterized RDD family membrane protein YckC